MSTTWTTSRTTSAASLIHVEGDSLLLPNAAVAEVCRSRRPTRWRAPPTGCSAASAGAGWQMPLVAFSRMAGIADEQGGLGSKVVVLKALGGNPQAPYFAVLTQGFPRLVTVPRDELLQHDDGEPLPDGVLARVTLREDSALVPDLARIEARIQEAPATGRLKPGSLPRERERENLSSKIPGEHLQRGDRGQSCGFGAQHAAPGARRRILRPAASRCPAATSRLGRSPAHIRHWECSTVVAASLRIEQQARRRQIRQRIGRGQAWPGDARAPALFRRPRRRPNASAAGACPRVRRPAAPRRVRRAPARRRRRPVRSPSAGSGPSSRRGRCPGPARSAAAIRCAPRACLRFRLRPLSPACRHDARVVVASVAVEQRAGVAGAEPQHAREVAAAPSAGRCARGRERRFDEAADHAHAVASTIASRVTRASSSSCASSMQYGGIQYSTSPSGRSTTPRSSAARYAAGPRATQDRAASPCRRRGSVERDDHAGWRTSATCGSAASGCASAAIFAAVARLRSSTPSCSKIARSQPRRAGQRIAGVAVRMQGRRVRANRRGSRRTAPAWPAPPTAA